MNHSPTLGSANRQSSMSVEAIQSGICAAAELPMAQARTIPAQAYTSEEFFAWETDHLLRAGWQCLAHVSQIPKPGDFLNLDLLGELLLVIRAKDQSVKILSRVCPHRSMDIMPEGFGYGGHGPAEARPGNISCGHTKLLLCPYHAWTFELDGTLKGCPEMHQAEGFERDQHALKSFRSAIWQGFIFVNLDGEAPALESGLEELSSDLANFQLEQMQLIISRDWDCRFNWKVLVENFMESYHHLGIHHRTLQPMMPARDTWTEEERPQYIRAHLPYKESVRQSLQEGKATEALGADLPALPGLNESQRFEWGLYLIHPTFLLATAPDRVIWYRIQPIAPGRIHLLTTTLVAPQALEHPNFAAMDERAAQLLTDFHLEDMEVCTAVQRGLNSSPRRSGPLSHLEMPVHLFHRFMAARIRGVWPDRLLPSQRP